MPRKAAKPRPSPWDPESRPYGSYSGPAGDEDSWRGAFQERMSPEEARRIVGDDSPWDILGVKPGASPQEVKTAYRNKAKETHPDHGGDAEAFKRVHAAYETLTNK